MKLQVAMGTGLPLIKDQLWLYTEKNQKSIAKLALACLIDPSDMVLRI